MFTAIFQLVLTYIEYIFSFATYSKAVWTSCRWVALLNFITSVVVTSAARTDIVEEYKNHKWKSKKEILMKFSECVLQYRGT